MLFRPKKPVPRLELAPIIDIVFILLIFFAVSTSLISNQEGIPLDLPSAQSTTPTSEGMILSVDSDQNLFIEETPILFDDLQAYIASLIAADPTLQIILNADRSITYDYIVQILDQVRLGGCFGISLQAEKRIIKDAE